jgi:hypothetical protein
VRPYILSLPNRNLTYVVAVDSQDPIDGRNDPSYVGCQRWTFTVFGNSTAPACLATSRRGPRTHPSRFAPYCA